MSYSLLSSCLISVVNVMRESGCEVPEFLISLKKPHKKILKKLENHPAARPSVIEKPHRYKYYKFPFFYVFCNFEIPKRFSLSVYCFCFPKRC